jgi:nucleoside-diphosphate-sugar epimerase
MRALVTGATGFIGRALTRRLLARGWDVTAFVRDPAKAPEGTAIAEGDIALRATVEQAVKGHDAVFHLAAWYALGVRDRARMERFNVDGARTVLTAARDAGASTIVHCSTVAALGREAPDGIGDESTPHPGAFGSIYEETKHRAHQEALELARDGAPIVVVMPGAVYGTGDHSMVGVLLKVYARKLLVACPFQDTGLSWVHVDDVGEGMARAAEHGTRGESYVLGGDNETIRGMFIRVAAYTGIRPPANLPDGLVKVALPLGPGIARLLGQEPRLLHEGLKSLHGSWMFSSLKAERELGYTHRPVEEGIPETVRAIRNR